MYKVHQKHKVHLVYLILEPLKLLARHLEELKSRGAVERNFDMDDYVCVDFVVSVTESSSLTDKERNISTRLQHWRIR